MHYFRILAVLASSALAVDIGNQVASGSSSGDVVQSQDNSGVTASGADGVTVSGQSVVGASGAPGQPGQDVGTTIIGSGSPGQTGSNMIMGGSTMNPTITDPSTSLTSAIAITAAAETADSVWWSEASAFESYVGSLLTSAISENHQYTILTPLYNSLTSQIATMTTLPLPDITSSVEAMFWSGVSSASTHLGAAPTMAPAALGGVVAGAIGIVAAVL